MSDDNGNEQYILLGFTSRVEEPFAAYIIRGSSKLKDDIRKDAVGILKDAGFTYVERAEVLRWSDLANLIKTKLVLFNETFNHDSLIRHLSSKLQEVEKDRDEWRAQTLNRNLDNAALSKKLEELQSYLREYLATPPVRTEFDGVAKRQELRKKLEELSR